MRRTAQLRQPLDGYRDEPPRRGRRLVLRVDLSRRPAHRRRVTALLIVAALGAALILAVLLGSPLAADDAVAQPPLLRRALLAVAGLLGAFALTLRGWDRIVGRRPWLGLSLILAGWLIGMVGLSLLQLVHDPSTWHWWL